MDVPDRRILHPARDQHHALDKWPELTREKIKNTKKKRHHSWPNSCMRKRAREIE
ncbi:hypothetical protein ASPZODRAFT_135089 [Penicilliopsis zonata CBS 506.65]|uniref:Uncharacterized protein n=1 Tax=Penicilliopsis zonata CBS 506.65 TaxID=1073090 RepID=A0A1L9SAX0_9EURO|nr:hypothetical protein ASPZODRAFT_135089 [Penicilliopsis zonata CBS 506.65]OJJ44286.1 hypothetical protein ASPZODRAFT_135089 [Penicilliopsis zonata CBS 506.65]